jgi:hypothetical protein
MSCQPQNRDNHDEDTQTNRVRFRKTGVMKSGPATYRGIGSFAFGHTLYVASSARNAEETIDG